MGLRSNCTMLYGHIETIEERVEHLLRLRALQDETGGFQTFIPLAFHPDGNALQPAGRRRPASRICAPSRFRACSCTTFRISRPTG
jgi:2-iminoacetate synthase ThiH